MLLKRLPMLLLLVPLIGIIVCAEHWGVPFRLWRDTEVGFLDTVQVFRVAVHGFPVERPATFRYEVEVLPSRARAYLYIKKDTSRLMPVWGDTLAVRTCFRQGPVLGGFDYGRWLRLNGIAATAFVSSRQWERWSSCSPAAARRIHCSPLWWRHVLLERYRQCGLSGEALGTVAAMSLGCREELDAEVKSAFRRSGAAHVLAVSGLHTGVIYALLVWLLTGFSLYPPLYDDMGRQVFQSVLIVVLMAGYAALTGLAPSVVRSVLMVALVELARVWHRQPFSLNTLAAAAFLILCFRPTDLYSVGFQLSFAATAAVILLEPPLRSLFPLTAAEGRWFFRPLVYVRGLLTVSLAAQLGTLPVTLFCFHETANWFLLANLVVLLLTFCIVAGSLLFFTLGWIPLLGRGLAWLLQQTAGMLDAWVAWVESLPGAVTQAAPSPWAAVGLFGLIAVFTALLRRVTQ